MTGNAWKLHVSAEVADGATTFRVWAPKARKLSLRLLSGKRAGIVPLQKEENGYFSALVEGVGAGDRYLYLPDDGPTRPDPASRFQPTGCTRLPRWSTPAFSLGGPGLVRDPPGRVCHL